MAGLAAVIFLASVGHGQWFCTSGLVPGEDAPHAAVRIDFTLSAGGDFSATGTVRPQGVTHQFDWRGAWTLADGQLAMIGKTRGRTFGIAPAGELRAIATVTQADVILLTLSSDAAPGRAMRCLTHPIE
ncbi:hypothetical protein [uncultured Tateyamaria sp.]|uniref:hypothetical protein n=1 Tax=Tateyamaria sp. 1078 TaxID=3417464 RepID=UPI002606AAF8|nr:hypothetical protein [uncultured Tateyamaria sp.]